MFWLAQDGAQAIPHAPFLSRALDRLAPGYGMDLPSNASALVRAMADSVRSAGADGWIVRGRADAGEPSACTALGGQAGGWGRAR